MKKLSLFFLIILLSSCSESAKKPIKPSGKLQILTSFSISADWLKEIGGEHVDVTSLVGIEEDCHLFRAKPQDMKKIADADLVYGLGAGFDKWLEKLHKSSGSTKKYTDLSKGLRLREVAVMHGDHSHGFVDPHLWHDISLVKKIVSKISESLSKQDPLHKADYERNLATYMAKLNALEKMIDLEVTKIPVEERKLVLSHDALGYFSDRYHFTTVALIYDSLSTSGVEPSAGAIASLIKKIKKENVKIIFAEKLGSDKLSKQVAKEAKLPLANELYTDALGKEGSGAETYLKLMEKNVKTIVNGMTP